MPVQRVQTLLLVTFISLLGKVSYCQTKSKFIDGREHNYCTSCKSLLDEMPKEVLFGLQINNDGEVFFSMSDKKWFEKIFKNNSYGVTIDIVSKERYLCTKVSTERFGIPKGHILPGVYKNELLNNSDELTQGSIFTKIGTVPASLIGKELEGNLVILNGPYICYYTNFVDIDRSVWNLLPMGLFVDSLLNESNSNNSYEKDYFTYSNRIQLEIPFFKGSSNFDPNFLNKYYDSIQLSSSIIKNIEIRAYSSIEGSEATNRTLMTKRAESVVQALKKYQQKISISNIVTAENWLDFFRDIKNTEFSSLENLSKLEVKKQLSKPEISLKIERILSKHRKVITTLYLESKTPFSLETDTSISIEFRNSIDTKNISKAQIIQKEIANRIANNQLPLAYIDKFEIPKSKEYSPLLNDREVYKYLLKATDEYQAFNNFIEIRKIDPNNGKLNYNICVLRFFMWQFGNDTISRSLLLNEINSLAKQGIHTTLIKRMKINYYILKSEDQLRNFQYEAKDSSLEEIRNLYKNTPASDEDIHSLAKYYSFYSHKDWAEEIITPRINDVNVANRSVPAIRADNCQHRL
jgi:CRISPR/Cas system-associated exonuclease Cas4 (RecB family)